MADSEVIEGGCGCGHVRYRVQGLPMIVHCCHCTWCQRESGSAFAVNALIETTRVSLTAGTLDWVDTPTKSGKGQRIARCPDCRIAVWSHYAYGAIGDAVIFLRVGSLDDAARMPPDVHVFTSTKCPWVQLPEGVPAFEGYYRASEVWSEASVARRTALYPSKPTAG